MESIEKKVILIASLFVLGMAVLLAYSIFGLNIRLPGCVTTVQPFTKGEVIKKTDTLYEVHMVAKMWAFEPLQIQVKPGTTVDFYLTSLDVNHGFDIEKTNINLMAVPGVINYGRFTFNEPGVYHFVCHEFCGFGHQNMAGTVVVSGGESEIPVEPVKVPLAGLALDGKKLFETKGCVACHSVEGNPGVGPAFKGLFGRKEKMSTGLVINVDEAYIAESIKEPSAKIVNGFQPLMPKLPVTDDEVKRITEYLKTL